MKWLDDLLRDCQHEIVISQQCRELSALARNNGDESEIRLMQKHLQDLIGQRSDAQRERMEQDRYIKVFGQK